MIEIARLPAAHAAMVHLAGALRLLDHILLGVLCGMFGPRYRWIIGRGRRIVLLQDPEAGLPDRGVTAKRPAGVLELGSSHGAFVGLMTCAGYQASGLELSPWVVEFSQEAFAVPVLLGPVMYFLLRLVRREKMLA